MDGIGATFFMVLFTVDFHINYVYSFETIVKIDERASNGYPIKHFWKSTGFCPPDPKMEVSKFLLSHEQKMNLALIGALPNGAIKHVRIHWLLNLIYVSFENGNLIYDFTYMDELMDWLHYHKLYPGFEIMGIPLSIAGNGTIMPFRIDTKAAMSFYHFWYDLVLRITRRYIKRYGLKHVKRWRFETWNEPDLTTYNILNFTVRDYLLYVRASRAALEDALEFESSSALKRLKLGGPAGLFRDPKEHPLCWGLLRYCNKSERHSCPIDFISFHRKGNGTTDQILNESLALLDLMYSTFSNIKHLPVANDEADILTNWALSEEWRGDVRYGAMIVKVVMDFYKRLISERRISTMLSNDNGFLNYHPYYFTQRTLLVRFQMNNTNPPHIQFIGKSAYSVMSLLSLLGDEHVKEEVTRPDPLVEFLATKAQRNKYKSETTSLLITYVNNTEKDEERMRTINALFYNLPDFNSKYVIYVLDNLITNPFLLWKAAGSPVFPSSSLREQMRRAGEPIRLRGPTSIVNSTLEVKMNLTLPTVALVHVCSRSSKPPGRVTHLAAYNVTRNEVLLIWKDSKVRSKCVLTYEVEFQPETGKNASAPFNRVNRRDTIFLWYQHVETGISAGEATRGRYRVRAVDYWNRKGEYSEVLSYPSRRM